MTNPTPYLTFQGTCREAMESYARIFDAEIEIMMRATEMPDFEVPPAKAGWIAHAALRLDGGLLMASDDIMGGAAPMAGCSVMLTFPTTDRGRAVFDALAEDGTVGMDYQPTFWSPGFGTVRDRFGTNWMISSDPSSDASAA